MRPFVADGDYVFFVRDREFPELYESGLTSMLLRPGEEPTEVTARLVVDAVADRSISFRHLPEGCDWFSLSRVTLTLNREAFRSLAYCGIAVDREFGRDLYVQDENVVSPSVGTVPEALPDVPKYLSQES